MQPTAHDEDAGLIDRRVLVVEDDPTVLEIVTTYLEAAGFLVDQATDGIAAVQRAEECHPDLIILDRMLPGIDGLEVSRRIRSISRTPVLMLTALGTTDDRIDGLEAGADDYLAKPFSPRELVLRVRSILRRTINEDTPEVPFDAGPFHLDVAARTVSKNGTDLALSTREFDLLAYLLKHPHQAFGRDQLLRAVWGWEFGDLSTITVTVRRLREKIENDPASPTILVTVWGVGYRLDISEEKTP
ncbi:response regulator transcription factor [Ruania rhizosphaerae]|uniref:response regulator transcription factor n=1 Tax=Ruania rhizosphaerae TaxID=1840413 RepID=UPI00135B3FC8|nr:response regulator transcription factor [Ruania rhizosphaerae]